LKKVNKCVKMSKHFKWELKILTHNFLLWV
jgi:hypothetical protein